MQSLANLLVQKPLNILVVAAVFGTAYMALRFSTLGVGKHASALLVPTAGWALYAAWEWLVMTRSPEANIRVDILLIWLVLLALTVWSVFKAAR